MAIFRGVWPTGVAACVRVLWLFPDRRLALCGLAGRGDCLCVFCGSSLTGDLPSAVWQDLHNYVCFDNLSYCDFFVSCCSTFSSLSPFNCGIKAKIVMDICGNENMNYTEKQVKGLK